MNELDKLLAMSEETALGLEKLKKETEKTTAKMEKMKIGGVEITTIESKVYSMISRQRTKNVTELGIGKDDNGNKLYHYLCHSCEIGLRSHSHDSLVLQMVAHLAEEKHMILLESY